MILVALWLPVLVIFAGLAIDVPHWFDYRRNLQTRADAAALAAGTAYGGTCFAAGVPTDPRDPAYNTLGQTAQAYAGPPPATPDANLPYAFGSVAQYYNQPNLSRGTPDNFHLLLNSTQNWDAGGMDYTMAPAGTFCDSTDESGREGPMVDVRLTQSQVRSFFGFALPPLFTPFSFRANISAHARVELQPVQSENDLRPIAVSEPGLTRCASAKFVDDTTGAVLATTPLTRAPLASGQPVTWNNAANPQPITMPANGEHVGVEVFLSDCQGNGQLYDPLNGALVWVNSYRSGTPAAGDPPRVVGDTYSGDPAPTGVTLTSTCNPYFFFSTTDCTTGVRASVAFSVPHTNPTTNAVQTFVSAGLDGNTTCSTTGQNQAIALTYQGTTGNRWVSSGGFTIPHQSGPHPIAICWKQQAGNVNGTACGNGTGQNPNPCTGTFGIQQRVYAGFNGDLLDPPQGSGYIVSATLSEPGVWSPGADSFQQGTTHDFVAEFKVSRFQVSQPTDPPTIIRFSLQTTSCSTPSPGPACNNHETGVIDCGQGNGASADINAIEFGCPDPFQINLRNGVCQPELATLSPPQADDCVHTTQGNRNNIITGFTDRIVSNGVCSTNSWWAYRSSGGTAAFPPNDPRAFTMIIAAPADLSGAGPTWVPILDFATFYVTGWSTQGSAPSCPAPQVDSSGNPLPGNPQNSNEPYPGAPRTNRASIWGHWINYTIPGSGAGSGMLCDPAAQPDPSQPLNCVAVLSR